MIDLSHIGEAIILAGIFWMRWKVKREFKKELTAQVAAMEERLLARIRDEYAALDYPNAKPIHDIHARLDVLVKHAEKEGPNA